MRAKPRGTDGGMRCGEWEPPPEPLIVGLGNECFGDDGIGICLVKALRGVRKYLLGTKGLQAAHDLVHEEVVVFVDADPEAEGAYLKEIEPEEGYDPHSVKPSEILAFMKLLGFRGKAYLLGIGGKRFCFPCSPSEEALRWATEAVKLLEEFLGRKVEVGKMECGCKS